MGVRGEIYSTKVSLQNRTYFFNIKENRLGDLYLNIVESKNRDEGGFERQSVILFADDLQSFLQGFDEALRVLEKAQREKRRGKKVEAQDSTRPSIGKHRSGPRSNEYRSNERPPRNGPRSNAPRSGEVSRRDRPPRRDEPQKRSGPKRPGTRPTGPDKKRDSAVQRKKKVVVRKPRN